MMARSTKLIPWSLMLILVAAGIPNSTYGSAPTSPAKTEKTAVKPTQEKLPAASRKQPTAVPFSVEDEENVSEHRSSFAPFPPGFIQGAPPRYNFGAMRPPNPDAASDRFDIEDAPGDSENHGMGFMSEFGPPKGFPDLSKLTGGEFGKMAAPTHGGAGEPYIQGGSGKNSRPSHYHFSPGSPPHGHGYEESDDGPSEPSPFGAGPAQSVTQFQSAPKRRPFRGRPAFPAGRPSGFGGPGGSSGPGPYGASDGHESGPFGSPDGPFGGGPGPYGGGPQHDGPSRPFGRRPSRPSGPFGGSSSPQSSRPFGSDGPSSRPGPFGGSDGPSRPNPFGSSDGPSSHTSFGPGHNIDGPERPSPFGSNADDSPRPGSFGGHDGPPTGNHFDSSDGPSRPGPSFLNVDGAPGPRPFGAPQRPGPFPGPPKRPSPFGAPGQGQHGPGSFSAAPGNGRENTGYSFTSHGPNPGAGFRLSRGYPRFHPNQIHNDDFKESADNADFSPHGPAPKRFNFPRPPPSFGSDDHPEASHHHESPRQRSHPDFPSHQRPQGFQSSFGNTHRFDSPKRPFVIKVSGLKSLKNPRDLPPGPPVFFAPSPDMQKTKDGSRKFQVAA